MGQFRIDTGRVRTSAAKIRNNADEFDRCIKRIDQIVNGIVSSQFTSPGANELGNEVKAHKPAMEEMQKTLENYGGYGTYVSKLAEQTDEDIAGMV